MFDKHREGESPFSIDEASQKNSTDSSTAMSTNNRDAATYRFLTTNQSLETIREVNSMASNSNMSGFVIG